MFSFRVSVWVSARVHTCMWKPKREREGEEEGTERTVCITLSSVTEIRSSLVHLPGSRPAQSHTLPLVLRFSLL